MWMGGTLPLGYNPPTDATTRALVVDDTEAATDRLMFTTYLELGSVHALQRWLAARGIVSTARTTAGGRATGALPFSRGALFHLLRNRTYLEMVVHKDKVLPGIHPAIVDADLFAAAQTMLDNNARRRSTRPNRVATAPLTGRVFDADGAPKSPTFSHGARGQVYRYYVSAPLQQGVRPNRTDDPANAVRRVPAVVLEARLAETLRRLLPRPADPLTQIVRVEIYPASVALLLPIALLPGIRLRLSPGETAAPDAADPARLRLDLPVRMRLRGGRTIIERDGSTTPTTVRRDPVLTGALRKAHALLAPSPDGLPTIETVPTTAYARRLIRLTFLAPNLQAAILDGRQPAALTLDRLVRMPLPCSWAEQGEAFTS